MLVPFSKFVLFFKVLIIIIGRNILNLNYKVCLAVARLASLPNYGVFFHIVDAINHCWHQYYRVFFWKKSAPVFDEII